MTGVPRVKLNLLMTGNELMSGVTVDSNSALVARLLEPLNLRVGCKLAIGDDMGQLCSEIDRLARMSEVLVVNGGLGPTSDDLTAEALARVVGVPLVESAAALEHLETWCGRRGLALNAANRKQAFLPQGAELIHNRVGSAVGFRLRHLGCEIICTPGPPGELRPMLEEHILPWLAGQYPNSEPVVITRFQLFGIGESSLQELIRREMPDWPAEVELGFRAGAPLLELKVSSFSESAQAARTSCEERLRVLLADHVIGMGDMTLPSCVVALLAARGEHVALAESCTGGLIAPLLTEVPGASRVFEAGYVVYANRMKERALGVSHATLEAHGAVSEQVVREMAAGALRESGAQHALAVSGIAGPEGGTPEKPVGTVWVAWGSAGNIRARELYFPVARKLFQTMVAATALDLLRRDLLGIAGDPRYFRERRVPR
jgi:nicotinamide-nucleotide amidase